MDVQGLCDIQTNINVYIFQAFHWFKVTNFTCEHELVLLSTTLASFCCFALIDAELEATMFDDACRSIAAQRPYFDEFMGLSRPQLTNQFLTWRREFLKENEIEEPFYHLYNMAYQILTDYGDFRFLNNASQLTSTILPKLKLCVQSNYIPLFQNKKL